MIVRVENCGQWCKRVEKHVLVSGMVSKRSCPAAKVNNNGGGVNAWNPPDREKFPAFYAANTIRTNSLLFSESPPIVK